MNNIILEASRYAKQHHQGQFRKYSGMPYITHPMRVAGRVSIYDQSTENMVAAAWLHDVIEDCDVSYEEFSLKFGNDIAHIVYELTNPSKNYPNLSRKERKAMDLEHIKDISKEAMIIKAFDRMDNLNESIGDSFNNPECKRFLKEKYYQESLALYNILDRHLDVEISMEFAEQLGFIEHYIL